MLQKYRNCHVGVAIVGRLLTWFLTGCLNFNSKSSAVFSFFYLTYFAHVSNSNSNLVIVNSKNSLDSCILGLVFNFVLFFSLLFEESEAKVCVHSI